MNCHPHLLSFTIREASGLGTQLNITIVFKVLIFDDSFEHEVWNESNGTRIVLIVDFNHPEVGELLDIWFQNEKCKNSCCF